MNQQKRNGIVVQSFGIKIVRRCGTAGVGYNYSVFEQYVKKEAQVLDVGCGDGYGTYKLSRAGYKAVGVDISEVMIQKGKERGEGPDLSFIKGDLSSLPFENEQFEAIMAINSLEWTEEPLRALNEIKRVLKVMDMHVLQF